MSEEEKVGMRRKLKVFADDNFSLGKVSEKYVEYFKSIQR